MDEASGILIIDKPAGITSHDVVARVRRIFGTKRVGHTGTLDPFATGVMVLLLGKATRLAQFLDKDAKEYVADVQFGARTDTGDNTGKIVGEGDPREILGSTDFDLVLDEFRGDQMQTPPMYSAKKIDGKKLYELARADKVVDREPVPISIYELAIVDRSEFADAARLKLRVACSAGTYIRTLAEDIGKRIGVGAHLTGLRRTAAGNFDLEQAHTIDELKSAQDPTDALLPLEHAVSKLPEFAVPDERIEATQAGLSTRIQDHAFADGAYVRMTINGGTVIGVGVYDDQEKSIRPKVVLI